MDVVQVTDRGTLCDAEGLAYDVGVRDVGDRRRRAEYTYAKGEQCQRDKARRTLVFRQLREQGERNGVTRVS